MEEEEGLSLMWGDPNIKEIQIGVQSVSDLQITGTTTAI